MNNPSENESSQEESGEDGDGENMFSAVNEVTTKLEAIEKFVARRFDEISAEIYATSEQMDMAEEDQKKKFSEIMEVIGAISHQGEGTTAANTGAELDAVVDLTEKAANTILDASSKITDTLGQEIDWSDETLRKAAFAQIDHQIQEIFMACSFQDLTGQRIRKALENIRGIEERLGDTLDKMGIEVEVTPQTNQALPEAGATQDDIDSLFD